MRDRLTIDKLEKFNFMYTWFIIQVVSGAIIGMIAFVFVGHDVELGMITGGAAAAYLKMMWIIFSS